MVRGLLYSKIPSTLKKKWKEKDVSEANIDDNSSKEERKGGIRRRIIDTVETLAAKAIAASVSQEYLKVIFGLYLQWL